MRDERNDDDLASSAARRGTSEAASRAARDSFAELYRRHAPMLLPFLLARARRADAEDLHQTVWQKAWERLPDSFKGGNFRAWLFQIARNLLIDLSRKAAAEPLDRDPASTRRSDGPAESMLEQERQAVLQSCLGKLDEDMALVVRARLAGESYEEVGARIGCEAPRLHKLFHQAKAQLQDCVQRALS